MNAADVEQLIAAFFREELDLAIDDYDEDLWAAGVLNSFNMIQVLTFAEEFSQSQIDIEDLDLKAFKSVRSIAAQLAKWKER